MIHKLYLTHYKEKRGRPTATSSAPAGGSPQTAELPAWSQAGGGPGAAPSPAAPRSGPRRPRTLIPLLESTGALSESLGLPFGPRGSGPLHTRTWAGPRRGSQRRCLPRPRTTASSESLCRPKSANGGVCAGRRLGLRLAACL